MATQPSTVTHLYTTQHVSPEKLVTVRVPATGGELWQGCLHERLVMVNCPIDFFGEAVVSRTPEDGTVSGLSGSPLLVEAATSVLEMTDASGGLHVKLNRPVPRGLGMASSTTELAATAYAAARAVGQTERSSRRIAHQVVSQLDSGNDGNYIEGLHLVDPSQNEVILSFGRVPALRVLLVNTGGQLATHAMDRELERSIGRRFRHRLNESFEKMIRGLTFQDMDLVGRAASECALVYQHITYKPHLEDVIRLASAHSGCVGVTCGHSGTVIGVLARPGSPSLGLLADELRGLYGPESVIGEFGLVSGGFHERVSL